jgi:uncharacterized BrkB/YihY/UPF0761 family membrane protein
MTSTPAAWKQRLRDGTKQVSGQVHKLEPRPLLGFPIATYRRFKEIEGKQLAFVIGGNMFISVIPLFIVGYAIIEAFNPDRSFAVVVIQKFQLHGDTAALVRQTFTNARSGRDVAVSISVVSLLVTGFGVATTVQTAYARAFRVVPLRGVAKFTRGGAWLLMLLTVTTVTLTLRYWAHSRPWWFLLLVLPPIAAVDFLFYLATPRLLTDVPFEWRHLVPGAAICVLAFGIVNAVSVFLMRRWLGTYGRAYGAFGVSLAFLSWIGILATFWVWIGAVAGVWWERFASPKELEAIEAARERRPGR